MADPAVPNSCAALDDEADRLAAQGERLRHASDERRGSNVLAAVVGATAFWPALLALRPPDHGGQSELQAWQARTQAVAQAQARLACGAPPDGLAPERRARLPLAEGDALVYEDRLGTGAEAQHWAAVLVAARRRQLDWALAAAEARPGPGSAPTAGPSWSQDLQGNAVLPPGQATPVLAWRRLLPERFALGQVLEGELLWPDQTQAWALVQAEVVSLGQQTLDGRALQTAVLALNGVRLQQHPNELMGQDLRLQGVLVVHRDSGLLLRLALDTADPSQRLQRRLVGVRRAAAP